MDGRNREAQPNSMATMYPEYFPGKQDPDDPEFEVYQTLKNLPAQYSVFYSKKFKGAQRAKDECEIDFIIFDGTTLLCLEVKGGQLEYRGAEDAWYQNGGRMERNPDRQASVGNSAVIDYLRAEVKNVNVGWALCFPNCELSAHAASPSSVPLNLIIDQNGLLDIRGRIAALSGYYAQQHGRPGALQAERARLVEKLIRGIGFVTSLGVRVAHDYQHILEVTAEQFEVLDDLEVNPRVIVKGYAGTGKTLIAQEFAKRLAGRGKKVLLLFFNRAVANTVRYGLERETTINCTTFHSLARQIITDAEPDWWKESSRKDDAFWNEDVPLKLMDMAPESLPTYDSIIIDEGQDFKRDWFEFIEDLMTDKNQGRLVVFYDENQDIFNHWGDLPWGATGIPRKVLTKNCRNTKSIVNYIKKGFPCDVVPFDGSPQGVSVVEKVVDSQADARGKLVEDVKGLLDAGIDPSEIIIIPNKPRPESCIAGLEKIGKYKLEWMGRSYKQGGKSIRYAGISLFKGLESNVVMVVDVDSNDTEAVNRLLYIEGSRARTLLYVYRMEVS